MGRRESGSPGDRADGRSAGPTPPRSDFEHPIARVEQGDLVGRRIRGDVWLFRGVPYAAPPTGPLRWRPPQPPAAWTTPRDAGAFGPVCPQPARPRETGETEDAPQTSRQSEDCLYLNVWSKGSAGEKRPVMVWIHGGAFRIGAGSDPVCDGTAFAKLGVVLVTFNYRLGKLGIFAPPALAAQGDGEPIGNYALMDQIAALRWVGRNIAAFGGDPSNVTVFGQSAGGESILYLLTSPASRGLFGKAVVQSGGVGGAWRAAKTLDEQRASDGDDVAERFGRHLSAEDLRSLPVERFTSERLDMFSPFVDGAVVVEPPADCFAAGRAQRVPLIIGNNDDEAITFMGRFGISSRDVMESLGPEGRTLYARLGGTEAEQARRALTDMQCTMPARFVARAMSRASPVWLYLFGAEHRTNLPFVFDTLDSSGGMPASAEDRAKAGLVNRLWASFAATGEPSDPGTAWPRFEEETGRLLCIAEQDGVVEHLRREQLDYLQGMPRSGLSSLGGAL